MVQLYQLNKEKRKEMEPTISYECQDLIDELSGDVAEFGGDLPVYAIYSWFEEYQVEFITDYLFADPPERVVSGFWSDEDEEEYQVELKEFKESLKTLEMTKHKIMTASELLEILEEQNRIF